MQASSHLASCLRMDDPHKQFGLYTHTSLGHASLLSHGLLAQVTALAQQRFDALAGVGGLGDLGLSALGSAAQAQLGGLGFRIAGLTGR